MTHAPVKPKRAPRADAKPAIHIPELPQVDAPAETPAPTDSVIAAVLHAASGDGALVGRHAVAAVEVDAPHADVVENEPQDIAAAPMDAPAPISRSPTPQPDPAAQLKERTMNETITAVADKVQHDAREAFTKVGGDAKAAVEKGRAALAEAGDFTRGNIEAMVESTRIAMKGLETMAQQRAQFAKQSFDTTAATVKSLVEVRSPVDFFKIQGEYVRTSVDALVAETSRSTEAALKLAGEVAQPIQNRVALAVEKIKLAA